MRSHFISCFVKWKQEKEAQIQFKIENIKQKNKKKHNKAPEMELLRQRCQNTYSV